MNLFPNMEEQQNKGTDDFILAAPVDRRVWWAIFDRSTMAPNTNVRYWRTKDTWAERSITIFLRESRHTLDDLEMACAQLRMIGITDRVYCVGASDGGHTPSMYAGARGDLCAMFDLS